MRLIDEARSASLAILAVCSRCLGSLVSACASRRTSRLRLMLYDHAHRATASAARTRSEVLPLLTLLPCAFCGPRPGMMKDELRTEVRDLFRFQFAATPADVADALGIAEDRAAALCAELGTPPPFNSSPGGRTCRPPASQHGR